MFVTINRDPIFDPGIWGFIDVTRPVPTKMFCCCRNHCRTLEVLLAWAHPHSAIKRCFFFPPTLSSRYTLKSKASTHLSGGLKSIPSIPTQDNRFYKSSWSVLYLSCGQSTYWQHVLAFLYKRSEKKIEHLPEVFGEIFKATLDTQFPLNPSLHFDSLCTRCKWNLENVAGLLCLVDVFTQFQCQLQKATAESSLVRLRLKSPWFSIKLC